MEDKLKEIGSLIRQARKEKNLSQSDLADLIQISISHMSDIENGKKKIGIDIFMKITEALDVSADWLLRTNTSNVKSIQNHEGKIDMIITKSVSRFARNVWLFVHIYG